LPGFLLISYHRFWWLIKINTLYTIWCQTTVWMTIKDMNAWSQCNWDIFGCLKGLEGSFSMAVMSLSFPFPYQLGLLAIMHCASISRWCYYHCYLLHIIMLPVCCISLCLLVETISRPWNNFICSFLFPNFVGEHVLFLMLLWKFTWIYNRET